MKLNNLIETEYDKIVDNVCNELNIDKLELCINNSEDSGIIAHVLCEVDTVSEQVNLVDDKIHFNVTAFETMIRDLGGYGIYVTKRETKQLIDYFIYHELHHVYMSQHLPSFMIETVYDDKAYLYIEREADKYALNKMTESDICSLIYYWHLCTLYSREMDERYYKVRDKRDEIIERMQRLIA